MRPEQPFAVPAVANPAPIGGDPVGLYPRDDARRNIEIIPGGFRVPVAENGDPALGYYEVVGGADFVVPRAEPAVAGAGFRFGAPALAPVRAEPAVAVAGAIGFGAPVGFDAAMPGFERVNVDRVVLQQARKGLKDYRNLLARIERFTHPDNAFEVEWKDQQRAFAQAACRGAVAPLLKQAGVQSYDDLQFVELGEGRTIVYRPKPEPVAPMEIGMAVPNGIPETTEPSLLSLEGTSSGSSASQGLSGGQIAGITVGSVAGASLIVAAIIFWRRRRNSSKSSCPSEPRLV